jgi:hypothetical protein
MRKPIKAFEPITPDQIKKVHSVTRATSLSDTDLYQMITDLTNVPSITALSKQEAIFLIDRLQGNEKRHYPSGPLFENEISGDTSALPSFYHIRDIRLMMQELGWDKQHMKNWLRKYRKVRDIRSMDRKQARGTYFVLRGMLDHKRPAGQDQ